MSFSETHYCSYTEKEIQNKIFLKNLKYKIQKSDIESIRLTLTKIMEDIMNAAVAVSSNTPILNYLKTPPSGPHKTDINSRSGTNYKINIRVNLKSNIKHPEYYIENANLKEQFQAKKELIDQTRAFLGKYFNEHPEALNDIQNGKIPEYFNEENTARRILSIFFSRYEGTEDRSAFADRAKSIISQAYSDVQGIVGGELPQVVQDTRKLVFEMIDSFKNGENKIFEFLNQ